MKIYVKKNTKVIDFVEELLNFLLIQYQDYRKFKDDFTFDITLINDNNVKAPDSNKTFYITPNGVLDDIAGAQEIALDMTLSNWNSFYHRTGLQYEHIRKCIVLDEDYLAAAEGNGRKQKNINQRKGVLKRRLKRHEELKKVIDVSSFINNRITAGDYDVHYVKKTADVSAMHEVVAVIDVDGKWCFDGDELVEGKFQK